MSGFSADWLARREGADRRARDPGLVQDLARAFAGRDRLAIVDLGCGAGSNLRALAPRLDADQDWRLVDHDPALLAAARERLAAFADAAEPHEGGLALRIGGRRVAVSFAQADLAQGAGPALGAAPDLVTAAALFDLVAPAWIDRFAAEVGARRAAFYTALTYDGVEEWRPAHPSDAAMLAAFHAHQARDKGFGPAAGPAATARLERAFAAQGYRVSVADSPWRLGLDDAALICDLAAGAAAAVRETGLVPEGAVADWLAAPREAAMIGHRDLLALPETA